jgi:hypothetical protein
MLVAQPSKRSGAELFANDLRYDIADGERTLGAVAVDRKRLGATITLEGETFTVVHARGAADESLGRAAVRIATGAAKPPPDRHELKDAQGRILAVAEQHGQVFTISHGGERFRFAKGRSRPFDLTREGEPAPLGSVGQRKFWTTSLHMDLPPAFDAPFQAFLLVVLLGLTLQRLEHMTDNTG